MKQYINMKAVADPGFPVGGGGGGAEPLGGRQPLIWVLFGENMCKNERIGSCWGGGGCAPVAPHPGSANGKDLQIL